MSLKCKKCKDILVEKDIKSHKEFLKEWIPHNHPDKGGDLKVFQEVSNCVDMFFKNNECDINKNYQQPREDAGGQRQRAEEEARQRQRAEEEEEARQRQRQRQRQRAEEEARQRQRAEEEARQRQRAEEEARQRQRAEEEARQRQRQRAEEEARQRQRQRQRQRAEEEARQRAEEARQRQRAEETRQRAREDAAEDAARQRDATRDAAEDAARQRDTERDTERDASRDAARQRQREEVAARQRQREEGAARQRELRQRQREIERENTTRPRQREELRKIETERVIKSDIVNVTFNDFQKTIQLWDINEINTFNNNNSFYKCLLFMKPYLQKINFGNNCENLFIKNNNNITTYNNDLCDYITNNSGLNYHFETMDKVRIKNLLKNSLTNSNCADNTYTIFRFVMPFFPDNRYYHIFGWIHDNQNIKRLVHINFGNPNNSVVYYDDDMFERIFDCCDYIDILVVHI